MRRTPEGTDPVAARSSTLARILFVVYVLLVAYASLYPLSGWRNVGVSPFAYLGEPWPRYFTAFDIVANVAGYLPFGFLATAVLHPRLRGLAVLAAAVAGATALSLVLEAGQSYLPARFPTTLDVLCNVGGAALGAALGQHFTLLIGGGPLSRWRAAAFVPGTGADFGLMLIGLWLFIQLNPTTLLFGAGDLQSVAPVHVEPRHLRDVHAVFEAFARVLDRALRMDHAALGVDMGQRVVDLSALRGFDIALEQLARQRVNLVEGRLRAVAQCVELVQLLS